LIYAEHPKNVTLFCLRQNSIRSQQVGGLRPLLLPLLLLTSCGSPSAAPACLETVDLACRPLHDPPTYQTLFDKILRPTCGVSGCHTAESRKGGLVFEDADAAHGLLLGTTGGRPRVLPGDPACSMLTERVGSSDPAFRMPPGAGLTDAQKCNFTLWIAQGAQR
jgi:hypothetical protein